MPLHWPQRARWQRGARPARGGPLTRTLTRTRTRTRTLINPNLTLTLTQTQTQTQILTLTLTLPQAGLSFAFTTNTLSMGSTAKAEIIRAICDELRIRAPSTLLPVVV